jgi:hypothetical protein
MARRTAGAWAVAIVVILTGTAVGPAGATGGATTDPVGDSDAAIDVKRITHDDTATEIVYTFEAAATFSDAQLAAHDVDWDASEDGLEVKAGKDPGVYCFPESGVAAKAGNVTVTRKATGSGSSTTQNSIEVRYPRGLLATCGITGLSYDYAVFVNDPQVTGVFEDAAPDDAPASTITHTMTPVTSADGRLPTVVRSSVWYLRNGLTTGVADASFTYGNPGDVPFMCDWDGNGTKTPGVRRGIAFYLRNANSSGAADTTITFGDPADVPVCGDWDGDGDETIGVVRGNRWFLFNRSTAGEDTNFMTFTYGDIGDVPVVGDWDGDGDDTVGVRRGIRFYLRDANSTGVATIAAFDFGNSGDIPVVADWDGDNDETVGVFRAGSWFFRNSNATGTASGSFGFGQGGDRPLTR